MSLELNDRETKVLRQFFDAMKLGNGRTVTEELRNLHSLPYVKNFVPKEGQIRLNASEFEDFADKILELVAAPERELDDENAELPAGSKIIIPTVLGDKTVVTKNKVCIYIHDKVKVEEV